MVFINRSYYRNNYFNVHYIKLLLLHLNFRKYGMFQVGNVVSALSSIFLYSLMARYITASDIGTFSLWVSTISLLFSFFSLGLHNVLTVLVPYYLNCDRSVVPKLISGNYIFGFIVSALVCILIFFSKIHFYNLLDISPEKIPMAVFAVYPFFALFNLNDCLFLGLKQIENRTMIEIARSIFLISIVIAFLESGYGLLGSLIGFCLSFMIFSIVGLIIHSFINAKRLGMNKKQISLTPIKEAITLGINVIPANISHFIISFSDRYFIASFYGTALVGIYATSIQLVSLLPFLMAPIFLMAVPYISEKWSRKDIYGIIEIKRKLTYAVFSMIIVCILITIFGKDILSTVYTNEYVGGYHSLVILSWGTIFYLFYLVVSNILGCVNEAHKAALIATVSMPLHILLNFLLVKSFGMNGVAIATSLTYMFMMILSIILWKKWLLKAQLLNELT